MYASTAPCADPDAGQASPFDAPPGWTEGVCTDEDAIPAGAQCGGAFCVKSLTIEAPHVEPCVASADAEIGIAPLTWGLVAQECIIEPLSHDGCNTTGEGCAPSPPPGFRLCVYRDGDDPKIPCPDPYTDARFVVYDEWTDTRGCSPCECGDPKGECIASISLFIDGACGTPYGSIPVSTANVEQCVDLPPGMALASKSGSFLIDNPGQCAPDPDGGKPFGEVTLGPPPGAPLTLCCQPPTPPPPP